MNNSVIFSGVDELEGAAQAHGWNIEYRQMGKGDFYAELASLEIKGIHLATEKFNNHLHIHCQPPEGFIGLCMPSTSAGYVEACGLRLTEGDLIAFPNSSEVELVTLNEIRNETIFMREAEFMAAICSLAPQAPLLRTGLAVVHHSDPGCLAAIRQEIGLLCQIGCSDFETASNLLAKTILWMTSSSSHTSIERLTNGASASIARTAQFYIEEKFRDVIHLHDLCAFTGVSLRTLQRSFATYFQMTPLNYIKARRLNATRRDLVAADPSGHSVTQIAIANGFHHLGRFSIEYREHFGELPSDTLATKMSHSKSHRILS